MDNRENIDIKKESNKKSTKLFFSGVLALTVANIIIKAIGLLFKIPLHDLLGDEGMGYFNSAYQIYTWLYMISTAGLPIAVSIMISENRAQGNFKQVKLIYKIAVVLFLVIGVVGTALMVLFAGQFAELTKIGVGAKYCVVAIAPTLLFICIASAMRGYFQGYQQMVPTAVSQVIEALGKLVVGILLALFAIDHYSVTDAAGTKVLPPEKLPVVAAFAIAGITIGALAGMIYIWVCKIVFKADKYDEEYATDESASMLPGKALLGRLVKIAIPITLSSSVMSLASMIDLFIIGDRLTAAGFADAATAMYGNYTTLCVPLFNLPPVLIYPISYSIIPMIAATYALGNIKKVKLIIESSLRTVSLIAIPCSLGLSVLARPILKMMFDEESANTAAPLLSVLSIAVFFVCIISVTNAVLQAYHKEGLTLLSMLIGAVVKLTASYILVGMPSVNIMGTPIGTLLCYFVASVFNIGFVIRYVGHVPSFTKVFLRPFAASLACAGTALGVSALAEKVVGSSGRMTNAVIALASIFAAVVVYALVIFLIRAIEKDDIMLLPKGEKIYNLLCRIKLMR